MPPSHLHTYPKTFNRWGHNRAFPFSSPVRLGLLYLFSCGIGLALLVDLFHSFGFENLNNAELLKKDVNISINSEKTVVGEEEGF